MVRARASVTVLATALWALPALTLAKNRVLLTEYTGNPDGRATTLYIAQGDGSQERPLLSDPVFEYDPSFSADQRWIVFTSERSGVANIYRIHPDGSGMERLTNDDSFDDQAALSPDGKRLAFVSTRAQGVTDVWVMDLATRHLHNLTHGAGSNFHPSWSPDGQWFAFSSDRDTFPRSRSPVGRFEEVQEVSVYVMRADGRDLRRLTPPGTVAGSPKWSPDGQRIVFYQTTADDAFDIRVQVDPRISGTYGPANLASQIVSVDVTTGTTTPLTSGPEYKVSPQYVRDEVAYVTRSSATMGVRFTKTGVGAAGEFRNPSWTTDGQRLVYERLRSDSLQQGQALHSKRPQEFNLTWSHTFPSVSRSGKVAVTYDFGRTTRVAVLKPDGSVEHTVSDPDNPNMAVYPSWSPDEAWIAYGQGAFFRGGSVASQIYLARPDGSDRHAVTSGSGNAGFPSFSPDGHRLVYRYRDQSGGGLRILNLDDGTSHALTTDRDDLPTWSPTGERIAFTRAVDGGFDIYTIRPDGSDLRRLTTAVGHDAHCAWSPDGKHLLFASGRYGFKDESALYYDWSTQPYTELFVMDADGSHQQALTDNKWEDGTAAWLP